LQSRILIVEDEVVIAMEIEAMLEQLGYSVTGHASRGEEAIELAGQQRPDLVLMDIRLKSEMDGVTAAEKIFRLYKIPVVFLTAHSDPSTLERAMMIQPYGYIIKPFRKNELFTTIEIALYKHRALTAEQGLQRETFKLHVIDHVTQYDIYNKLLALSGFFEILEMELPESEAARERLAKIKGILESINHQLKFEENYQKLGSRGAEWHKIPVLIDEARKAVLTETISVENLAGPVEIHADPLFGQVFPRIFENSVEHGATVKKIRVSFRECEESASLIVEDDGRGIDPEMKRDLFTKDLLQAKGKGLFLVREILQVSGMTFRETGEPGKGARFEIAVSRGQYRMKPEGD
jgi:CheY-like chemotaxis protein